MSLKKVYCMPTIEQAMQDDSNSINQIVLRIAKHLSEFGWIVVSNPDEADIIVAHAGQTHNANHHCDVAHCHGLYPTYHFSEPKWHFAANINVIENLRHARVVTTPSTWVADILRRDMNIAPVVVNWAIERDEFVSQNWGDTRHKGYTLWNKTRVDSVCDPAPLIHLAKAIPDAQFMTTFAPHNFNEQMPNLTVTGRTDYATMQHMVRDSAIYLATTKETFGIGTLEAMAFGTPILGYKWGGTADIVEHGVTGYLVEPHDLDGLVQGWRYCMRYRRILGENAQEVARDNHYHWMRVVEQFAAIYDDVLRMKQIERYAPKVSVVIPSYNYSQWLPNAVMSVLRQETNFEVELIVVDDCSTDDTYDTACALQYDYRFKYIRNAQNLGVAATRNKGIALASGQYITCLDADDQLGSPRFLQILADALDATPTLGIAYTGLATFTDSVESGIYPNLFPPEFNAIEQLKGRNQVPTCNMFRKRAWSQAGGYQAQYIPAEDANLWLNIMMQGWDIRKVTDEYIFYYRFHPNSLSAQVRAGNKVEPNWTLPYTGARSNPKTIPFASRVTPLETKHSHPVRNYDKPLVSVIIPVGSGHEQSVKRAIDSVQAQTEWQWECIVINDTGVTLPIGRTWVKQIDLMGGKRGAGYARNAGLQIAQGKFVVFLDADDMFMPDFLEKTLSMYRMTGRYVYTDWYEEHNKGDWNVHVADGYSQEVILNKSSIHAITCLIPRQWITEIGGFNEQLSSWEDSDLFIKLAIKGKCGTRCPEPLFVYNYDSGKRREIGVNLTEQLKVYFDQTFRPYRTGAKMACKCAELAAKLKQTAYDVPDGDLVKVVLLKGGEGKELVKGSSGTNYGQWAKGEIFFILAKDAKSNPARFAEVVTDETPVTTNDPEIPQRV